jgi:hypothetical protein
VHPDALLPLHRHANAIRRALSHLWPTLHALTCLCVVPALAPHALVHCVAPLGRRVYFPRAHALGQFQSPAAHDRARADQCAITISACAPSHPPGRVSRPPRLCARAPARLLGWRQSSPTRARDARPLRSATPACNQLLVFFSSHLMATCLYSFFCKNGCSDYHHQRPLHISFPLSRVRHQCSIRQLMTTLWFSLSWCACISCPHKARGRFLRTARSPLLQEPQSKSSEMPALLPLLIPRFPPFTPSRVTDGHRPCCGPFILSVCVL